MVSRVRDPKSLRSAHSGGTGTFERQADPAGTSSSSDGSISHSGLLSRLLARQEPPPQQYEGSAPAGSAGRSSHLKGPPHRGVVRTYALSVPDRQLAYRVWTCLAQKWGDANTGFPYLPQLYHLDCRVEEENVRSWKDLNSAANEDGHHQDTADENEEDLSIIRHNRAENQHSPGAAQVPSLAAEKGQQARRLLRLTDVGGAAVLEKADLRTELAEMLTRHTGDRSAYVRLVRVNWPYDACRRNLRAVNNTNVVEAQITEESPTVASFEEERKSIKPFTFCELFAGLGGFRIALQALGGSCVFASEIDPITQGVYAGRWGEKPPQTVVHDKKFPKKGEAPQPDGESSAIGPGKLHGDITKIPCEHIPAHDLLVGGFPCQPFSRLGFQDGFEDKLERGKLYLEILRILKEKRPKMFLLENVPGIADPFDNPDLKEQTEGAEGAAAGSGRKRASAATGELFQRKKRRVDSKSSHSSPLDVILDDLHLGGLYSVQAKIYSSAPLTAQNRRRVYFVGILREKGQKRRKIRFPEAITPDLKLRAADVICFGQPFFSIKNSSANSSSSSSSEKDSQRALRLSPTQFQTLFEKLPHLQQSGKSLPFVWPDTKLGPIVSHYGHSPQNGASALVTRPTNSLEGGVPRVLSREECFRVMGMNPAEFMPMMEADWIASNSRLLKKKASYKIIGNAVCPPVIAWLAEKVVLPAGGFVEKKGEVLGDCSSEGKGNIDKEKKLPVYLQLALDAVLGEVADC